MSNEEQKIKPVTHHHCPWCGDIFTEKYEHQRHYSECIYFFHFIYQIANQIAQKLPFQFDAKGNLKVKVSVQSPLWGKPWERRDMEDLSMFSDMDLVQMQKDLRQFPEDKEMLNKVLEELKKRHLEHLAQGE